MAFRGVIFFVCVAVAAADVVGHTDVLKSAQQPRWKRAPRTEKVEPIVTTGLITETLRLCADFYETVWDILVEDHLHRFDGGVVVAGKVAIPAPHVLAATLAEKTGTKPQLEQATAQLATAKLTLAAHHATAWDAAQGALVSLDGYASIAVAKFEAQMPEYAGLIPKNFLDLILFKVYMLFVLYVLIKLLRMALRIVKTLICGVCCCGLCRRRKASQPVSKGVAKKNEKKEAAATPKATAGKKK